MVAGLAPCQFSGYFLGTRFSVFSPLPWNYRAVSAFCTKAGCVLVANWAFFVLRWCKWTSRNADSGTIVSLWKCSVFSVTAKQNTLGQKMSFPGLCTLEPLNFSCELGARCARDCWGLAGYLGSRLQCAPAAAERGTRPPRKYTGGKM